MMTSIKKATWEPKSENIIIIANPANKHVAHICKPRYVFLVFIIILVVSAFATIWYIFFAKPRPTFDNGDNNTTVTYTDVFPEDYINGRIKLVPVTIPLTSRLKLSLRTSTDKIQQLALPVPYVIIMHTATENCFTITQCFMTMLRIRRFHLESRNLPEIGYNFLVGGDGNAYIGRGWKVQGAHTDNYNSRSLGISLIGDFTSTPLSDKQILSTKRLIKFGVQEGYIAYDYELLTARKVWAANSTETFLDKEVKTWSHWTE